VNTRLARRLAPVVYGLVVVLAALVVSGVVLVAVCLIGAVTVGMFYVVTAPPPEKSRPE
jgi:hypothetical protein